MTSETIAAKLVSIGRCVERIREHTPASPEELGSDYDAQDIISVNLQRAVQLSVDAAGVIIAARGLPSPATMADSFRTLAEAGVLDRESAERLAKAVGFRNISVHEYEEIDWKIVYSIVTERLDDFRAFVRAVKAEV